jgi:DNA-binding NtrC family response regulator
LTDQSKLNTTILLLVSDRLVRSVVGETLDREGYMVIPVGDLGSAVDWLKTSTPDLLIVRTYVSDMEGHDAAKYLQTKCPSMRVLMVGGLLDDKRLQYREAIAGFEVFPKPYTAGQLIEKVKEVLATAREGAKDQGL